MKFDRSLKGVSFLENYIRYPEQGLQTVIGGDK